MNTFTKPDRPMGGQAILASHMASHARAIEELQRALNPTGGRYKEIFAKFGIKQFCLKYRDEGNLMLLGGAVSGGTGNINVADLTLAVIDEEPVDGTHHWLEVSFTALIVDDVVLPGGDVTAVTDGSGTTIPDNVIPTFSEPNGTLYILLGNWSNGKFYQSGCGNFAVSYCPGSFTYYRIGEIP